MIKYILLLFTIFSFSQEHILIGDSQTRYLAKYSTKIKRVPKLSQGGIGVVQLVYKVSSYPVSPNVKSVSICIGVNDRYKDKGIQQLFIRLINTFPNAHFYIIQGSWGWGGVSKMNQSNLDKYYKQFLGTIIHPAIGNGDPHTDKKVYKTIMNSLENQI